MSSSLLCFVAVFVVFAIADRRLTRRSGVHMPDLWTMLLVAAIAIVKSLYADRLPLDDWTQATVWLALFAVPYLSLRGFLPRRRRQAHAAESSDGAPPGP